MPELDGYRLTPLLEKIESETVIVVVRGCCCFGDEDIVVLRGLLVLIE